VPKILLAVLAILGMVCGRASAQTALPNLEFGNGYLEMCGAPAAEPLDTFCIYYVIGALHYDRFLADAKVATPIRYCAPPNATYRQIKDILVAYLNRNPAERDRHTAGLLMLALNRAFPCR